MEAEMRRKSEEESIRRAESELEKVANVVSPEQIEPVEQQISAAEHMAMAKEKRRVAEQERVANAEAERIAFEEQQKLQIERKIKEHKEQNEKLEI